MPIQLLVSSYMARFGLLKAEAEQADLRST